MDMITSANTYISHYNLPQTSSIAYICKQPLTNDYVTLTLPHNLFPQSFQSSFYVPFSFPHICPSLLHSVITQLLHSGQKVCRHLLCHFIQHYLISLASKCSPYSLASSSHKVSEYVSDTKLLTKE